MKKNFKIVVMLLGAILFHNVSFGQNTLKESNFGPNIYDYLNKHKDKYPFSPSDIADIRINREVVSRKTDITRYYLNQTYQGIKIYNAISVVGVKNNKIFHFANKFKTNIREKINVRSPSLTMEQAIQQAVSHFKLGPVSGLQLIETDQGKYIFSKAGISKENIPVELVYAPLEDGTLRLAWNLSIYTMDGAHWWSMRIDAINGDILDVNDWVIKCRFGQDRTHVVLHGVQNNTKSFNLFKASSFMVNDGSEYTVFALPLENPLEGSRSIVANPADGTASPYGWHDTDGVAGPEYTITRGNNVWALEDVANDDLDESEPTTIGDSPDGTAGLDFNFPLDLSQEPMVYQDAATTNLFYINNMLHDILYNHGFDEASGNFQENNYGNGGVAGDYVIAEAQDGAGVDNANFATPPDGSNPVMQMYLFDTPIPPLLNINGGTLAGEYLAVLPSDGEGDDGVGNITRPTDVPITADLVIVDDGTAAGEEGCNALTNGAAVSGKIALIRRGSCNFTVKIQNAQDAGAVAVIVANHNNPTNDPNYSEYVAMYGVTDPPFTIPSIFINYTDGQAFFDAIGNGETINATIVNNQGVQLDGSLDNGIIIHEYAHGISTRLTGGASTSDCLESTFQAGEGWSDWFALMLTMKSSDVGTDGRGIGNYAFSQPVDGPGIRFRRYSTDFAINDYTYGDTNDNTEIGTDPDTGDPIILNRFIYYHGEIWANMLWDLTWAYIDKYGFDSDLFNGSGGNNRVLNVVIEGLKLQGCNPEYLEARDAILAADVALYNGADQCLIWEVFARRGLGVNASEGIPFKLEDQVEDFTTPDPGDPSLANCTTLSTSTVAFKNYKVYPNPARNQITIEAYTNLGEVSVQLMDINGRIVLRKDNESLNGKLILAVKHVNPGLYLLNIKGDNGNAVEKVIIH
ncbi:T9SS-dependent M36 family metallopeptidase [Aestuariivivens sp. NBU2969]|uniref:T9SS-dependent M36 family metallopeptidase n=1 Tax=Aestuariivivens sp. NBU2969 TaxID=2873267 RepID=UPI001CBDCD79|nr:T9SS-dependent M36 family metallopeptidase [Aestuariivivens sp. NBU2969]